MTWIDDIAAHLETSGHGTRGTSGTGTHILSNKFDKKSPDCIALLIAPGQSEKKTYGGKIKLSCPELDVRVRNMDDATAETKAKAIHALLNVVTSQHIGSTDFFRIRAQQDPFFLEENDNDRFIYAVNFDVEIEV